jgi:hypothetical protein
MVYLANCSDIGQTAAEIQARLQIKVDARCDAAGRARRHRPSDSDSPFRPRLNYAVLGSVLAAMFFAASGAAQATNRYAASPSFADVTTAIGSALDGDTVIVPAGTADWTTATLTITKGITLQGQTTISGDHTTSMTANDQTVIQDDVPRSPFPKVGQIIVFNTTAGQTVRLTGFTFKGGTAPEGYSGSIVLAGTSHTVRVDHCHFLNLVGNHTIQTYGWVYGVLDHNIFDTNSAATAYVQHDAYGGGTVGDKAWVDGPQFGTANFLFFEDNFFNNTTAVSTIGALDGIGGSRWVVRYNKFHNCFAGGHGTETVSRGTRAEEQYNNNFNWSYAAIGGSLRSGTMLSHDNTWTGVRGAVPRFIQAFRTFISLPPFGGASGANPWDLNDTEGNGTNVAGHVPFLYNSGTHTGASGATILTDSTKSWTTNRWAGYTVLNTTINQVGLITSNTNNTITYELYPDSGGPLKFNTGDTYQIHKLLAALDSPGRGAGDLLTRVGGNNSNPVNSTTGTIAWPHQALEPCYSWNDIYTPTNTLLGIQAGTGSMLKSGVEYFNSATQPSALSGYTPYTYPHPLVSGASQTPSAPTNLRIMGP